MTTTEQRLAAALREAFIFVTNVPTDSQLDASVRALGGATARSRIGQWREALAAYDAQQAHDVADGAWSANAGSVWDHTGKWIADCNIEHAARIVQCVNAHDALVSALRDCVERLGIVIESDTDDALHGASPDDVAAYEAGRAALEAAGSPNA